MALDACFAEDVRFVVYIKAEKPEGKRLFVVGRVGELISIYRQDGKQLADY